MKHQQAQLLLSDLLEGALPADQLREAEAHLADCEQCRTDLDLLRRALQLVHQLPSVEAPPEFSARLHRLARKASLFGPRRRRPVSRYMVPFEAVMAVLLAAMGALVISLLMLPGRLQTVVVEYTPTVLLLETSEQVNLAARAGWEAGGELYAMGRLVPPHTPLGATPELELRLPPECWPPLRQALQEIAPAARLPQNPPPAKDDGLVHVIVQICLSRTKQPPPAAIDPASSSGRPQTRPGPWKPPLDDTE